MSRIPDRENKIVYVQGQMEVAKMYANYWCAMATTGSVKRRDLGRGREPTDEERAKGEIIGWTQVSDEEKTADALRIMKIHIQRYSDLNDLLHSLLHDDLESYNLSK